MRNIILTLAVIASFHTSTCAQFKLGLQSGAVMSRILLTYDGMKLNTKLKPGYTLALNGDLELAAHWHLQAQAFYMRHNVYGVALFLPPGVPPPSKVICHTLQVPALVVYKLGHQGGNKLGIGAGAYAAWNGRGSIYWPGGSRRDLAIGSQADYQNNQADNIKEFDYGLSACLTYELKNGLYVHGRCSSGMANMLPGGNATYFMRTQAISLSAGYYFRHMPSFRKHSKTEKPNRQRTPRKLYPGVDE